MQSIRRSSCCGRALAPAKRRTRNAQEIGANTAANERGQLYDCCGFKFFNSFIAQPVARRALRLNSEGRTSAAESRKARRLTRQEHSHAVFSLRPRVQFASVVERKDRGVYFKVLNGEQENYFGQVLAYIPPPGAPAQQTINSPNRDLSAPGTAQLEIALQGANAGFHQIGVEFNNVSIGTFSFNGLDPATGGHPVQLFSIPLAQLNDGANTIKFTIPSPGDLTVVDYTRLTYPHLYKADAGSLRFSLRGSQTRTVDGFPTRLVRVIDYTDPYNCIVIKPDAEPSASGFAITVPAAVSGSKARACCMRFPRTNLRRQHH